MPFVSNRAANTIIRIAAVVLLLSVLGCGAGSGKNISVSVSPPPAISADSEPGSLPSVAELQALYPRRAISDIDYDHYNFGGGFNSIYGSNKVASIGILGLSAEFNPAFSPGGKLADGAWCIYTFRPYGLGPGTRLQFNWSTPPAAGQTWVGLSNFSRMSWDWLALDSQNGVDIDPGLFSSTEGSQLFAALFVMGNQQAVLSDIRLGDPGLTAVLQVDQQGAGAGFIHQFDASASFSTTSAALTGFEWDWEGDGTVDESTAVPGNTHQYAADGLHFARVRVTNADGAVDWATLPIFTWSETEENDNKATADPLPAFPFHNWTGNCGNGLFFGGGAYDGDAADYLGFNCSPGDVLNFELTVYGSRNLHFQLFDADDLLLLQTSSNAATFPVAFQVHPSNALPLYAKLVSNPTHGGAVNYVLRGCIGQRPLANLTYFFDHAWFPMTVTFDPAASSDPDGSISLYEMDFDNDGIYDASNSDGAAFPHTYTAGYQAFNPATLRVTDDQGNTGMFSVGITNDPSNIEFESNDSAAEASSLGVLPAQVSGSVGVNSNDGDNQDWWIIGSAPNGVVSCQLSFDRDLTFGFFGNFSTLNNRLSMLLYDNDGDLLAAASSDFLDGEFGLDYALLPGDNEPLFVSVESDFGGSPYTLHVGGSEAPSAVLPAYNYSTPPGVEVTFDASGSLDDQAVNGYEWDFDGDGVADSNQGPVATWSFGSLGIYFCSLKVSDADGNTDKRQFMVRAATDNSVYGEIESNDVLMSAQPVALPLYRLAGNLGPDGNYDGDNRDYFDLGNLEPGTHLAVKLEFAHLAADLDVYLRDADQNVLADSRSSISRIEQFEYTVGQFINMPLYIEVENFAGLGDADYLLSVAEVQ
ncbi:PKD domain-containing protein [bacterium]|nr:PKD domain-containing protein [bacterium]